MTYNSSGPETSTAVVEGGAREVDLLGSEISFEINASAIPAAKLRELVRECIERHVDKRKLELLRIAEQIRARVSGEVGRNIWRGPVMSARHHRRRSPEATIQRAVFAHLRARGASGLFAFHPANGGYRRSETQLATIAAMEAAGALHR
jgi:hypothetical protein